MRVLTAIKFPIRFIAELPEHRIHDPFVFLGSFLRWSYLKNQTVFFVSWLLRGGLHRDRIPPVLQLWSNGFEGIRSEYVDQFSINTELAVERVIPSAVYAFHIKQ